jgi:hypothetical protein
VVSADGACLGACVRVAREYVLLYQAPDHDVRAHQLINMLSLSSLSYSIYAWLCSIN